jgi:hypothetical protein
MQCFSKCRQSALALSVFLFAASAVPAEIPEAWKPRLLPGQEGVVFSYYPAPADVAALEELIAVLKREHLANGFDPGPTPVPEAQAAFDLLATLGWPVVSYPPHYGEFQIAGSHSRLDDAHEAVLQTLDRAGAFNALQLGEWGYYFHELSHSEAWWKSTYGEELETFRPLMKSAELRGYDTLPATRPEAYAQLKGYFLERLNSQRGRTISITGHSHYECYAAAWGARTIGIELGENIGFTQSKLAFTRGAARQWGIPFTVQVSPWFGPNCTTAGPLRRGEDGITRGLDAGHSLSFYRRIWLHAWFAGAAMVTPENSAAIWFEPEEPRYRLTDHARAAAEVFRFMLSHDRGVPYTPVAIVVDEYTGYNGFQGKPWGIFENTPGDQQLRDLLEHQLFPGADFRHEPVAPERLESHYLRPTPYGEICDVLLSNAAPAVLSAYPVLLIAGDHGFPPTFVNALKDALHAGSRLLLNESHRHALGEQFTELESTGRLTLIPASRCESTGRPEAIAPAELARIASKLLPVSVSGDEVQFQVNRNGKGWVVELVNNCGVQKWPDQPAQIDPEAAITVSVEARLPMSQAVEWWTDTTYPPDQPVRMTIPPGESRFLELTLAN